MNGQGTGKRGIWMGGNVPLGYRVDSRRLVVVEDEAPLVQRLFTRTASSRATHSSSAFLCASSARVAALNQRVILDRLGKEVLVARAEQRTIIY